MRPTLDDEDDGPIDDPPLDDEELAADSSSADDTEVPLAEMAKWYLTTTRRLSRAI